MIELGCVGYKNFTFVVWSSVTFYSLLMCMKKTKQRCCHILLLI